MIKFLLQNKALRKKIIFQLKHNFFSELNYSIPVKSGYWAQLLEQDSFDPFSEIFIKGEYLEFLPNEPIHKVLDIGANYGYFSLWLQSVQSDISLQSCLVEPSTSCKVSLKNLINNQKLHGRFKYIPKAVGNPTDNTTSFYDRPFMASSSFDDQPFKSFNHVEILKSSDVFDEISAPYDLLKCDIEGSEWELLNYYEDLISLSKFILIEWHSWHTGGGGVKTIEEKLSSLGFKILKQSDSIPAVGRNGYVGIILATKLR